jgi:hypothetical protein
MEFAVEFVTGITLYLWFGFTIWAVSVIRFGRLEPGDGWRLVVVLLTWPLVVIFVILAIIRKR